MHSSIETKRKYYASELIATLLIWKGWCYAAWIWIAA